MVLPIIAGAGILAYIAFAKDILGEKNYNTGIKIIFGTIIIIIAYIGYKWYMLQKKVKEVYKDTEKTIIEKYMWLTEGAKEETEKILTSDPRWEDVPEIKQDIIFSGEQISQIFGGSAYTAGQEIAQKSYDNFENRYGIETAKEYEKLPGTGRTLVSIGDYITAGLATDLGHKTGELVNKYKFW